MTTALTEPGVLERLLASLALPAAGAPSGQPGWLKALRAQALERAQALSLPTTRMEAWRFTSLAAFTRQRFQALPAPSALQLTDIEPFCIEEAGSRLVFVDGMYAPQLSSVSTDSGLTLAPLSSALQTGASAIEQHLGRQVAYHDALFAALNTAFLSDAAVLLVPAGAAVAKPVHLLFVSTQSNVACHPRLLLVAGANASVTLIEDYVALHSGAYFTNSVAELTLAANAQVEHVRVQRESRQAFHLASCAVALASDSRYHSTSVAVGAQISRLDLQVRQTGAGAQCLLDGLALIGGEQLADSHTFIDHMQPNGNSRQLHKCIVGGAAHAVFNGKVMVRPGAQQTDSAQSSRNLLLSSQAQVDTQPQLEIFADDVKCTHGATVGQLDAEEVFYLQSRGLPEALARNLLTYAFGAEIIDRIPVASLRQRLEQAVLHQTSNPS